MADSASAAVVGATESQPTQHKRRKIGGGEQHSSSVSGGSSSGSGGGGRKRSATDGAGAGAGEQAKSAKIQVSGLECPRSGSGFGFREEPGDAVTGQGLGVGKVRSSKSYQPPFGFITARSLTGSKVREDRVDES